MRQKLIRLVVACALVALGWAAATAQTPAPAFELIVDAPEGETTITCTRGCQVSWVERGINPNDRPRATFSYSCRGSSSGRCGSGHIGGWITQ